MTANKPSPEEVFHGARAITSPAERDGFLRGACGGDLALRSKVDALLKADDEAGAFLASGDQAKGGSDASGVARPHEQIGAMIGRYKLLQEIGEGGFGVVYLAEQKQPMRRKVALKVIKLGMDTKQVIARFEAERQALAMMDHPNIAKVLDAGATDSGRPYFVMELVKGISITEYCDQNNLSIQERLDLFTLVCGAVQHAHQKGIIHRDIKPTNVLVTLHDGVPVPKVIDFGIAKATSAELTEKTLFTQHGQMIGTPIYMSPEQAELSGLDIDTRSDIYSLGVLLYELLTGTTPFTIQELREVGYAEMQRFIREQEPQKPSTRLSTLDSLPSVAAHRRIEPRKLGLLIRGDIDWIIMKALEKDRTRRYETANAFASDISRFLGDEPVLASPPSAAYRLRKFVRRNRKGVISGAVLAVALLGIAGISIHFGIKEKRLRRTTQSALAAEAEQHRLAVRSTELLEQSTVQLTRTNVRLASETERAERQSYSALLQSAQAQLRTGNIKDAQRLHALCPKPYRNWEWMHLKVSLDQSLGTLGMQASEVFSCAWSPDGARVVAGSYGALRIWDARNEGRTLATLIGHEQWVNSVTWSPDGTRILSGSSDKTLRIWDAVSGKCLRILKGHDSGVESAAWSPDGTRVVSGGSSDRKVIIWEASSGEILQAFGNSDQRGMVRVAWNPDGTRIASGSWSELHIWDAFSGDELESLPAVIPDPLGAQVFCLAWSPDGKRIASGWGDYSLRIWNVSEAGNLLSLEVPQSLVSSVAWSPDGKRIVVSDTDDETIRILDAANGEKLQTLRGHVGGVSSVSWNPDGTRILSGSFDKTLRIWDAASGETPQSLATNGGWAGSVTWSPNGKQIIFASEDGYLRILDAASGETQSKLQGHGPLAWNPDGTRIIAGADGQTMRIWDVTTGESLLSLPGVGEYLNSVAWSPDGKRIVSGAEDKPLRIWDALSGEIRLTVEADVDYTRAVAWSPDGMHLATGLYDGNLHILDGVSGEKLMTLEGSGTRLRSVAWSPDGMRLVAGLRSELQIWNAASGESLLRLRGHGDMVPCVAWSPDGKRIVSGSHDKTLRIWDATNGENLLTLWGHTGWVNSVAWSPDGRRIASSASDGTLRIWESQLEDALPLWRAENRRRLVRADLRQAQEQSEKSVGQDQ